MQVSAFVAMNAKRHQDAHANLFWNYVDGDAEKARAVETFYDEYFAVLDLTAEFYLETVKTVFQDYTLARNELTYRGERIDMGAIRRTALMTVEGERDDICAVGQTMAAHDLCSSLPPHMKSHHLQAGVGHYGVFSGRKWEGQTYRWCATSSPPTPEAGRQTGIPRPSFRARPRPPSKDGRGSGERR